MLKLCTFVLDLFHLKRKEYDPDSRSQAQSKLSVKESEHQAVEFRDDDTKNENKRTIMTERSEGGGEREDERNRERGRERCNNVWPRSASGVLPLKKPAGM